MGISDLSKSRSSMAPPAPTSVCSYIQCRHKKGAKGAEGAEEALDPSDLRESDKLTDREIDKEFVSPPPRFAKLMTALYT